VSRERESMKRSKVESSALRSVGYDADLAVLEVEFNDGRVYRYFGIGRSLHQGLLSAKSVGSYYLSHIKDGGFGYERVR
jgi:hypothetical protein